MGVRVPPGVLKNPAFARFDGEVCPKRVLDMCARCGHDRVYLMTTNPNLMDEQNPVAFFEARRQNILNALSQHMVALSWMDRLIDPIGDPTTLESRRPMTQVVTGFLLGVRNRAFIVVAGHVLTQLEKRLAGREIVKARIIDSFEGDEYAGHSIPFPLADAPRDRFDDGHTIDYGVILLESHYARLLDRAGKVALCEADWSTPRGTPDFRILLGFPRAGRTVTDTCTPERYEVTLDVGLTMLRVSATDDPPDCLRGAFDRFFGHVIRGTGYRNGRVIEVDDIDGMSGGPVFGVHIEQGRIKFSLVGIQSGWEPDSRVIAACPVPPFAEWLAGMIDGKTALGKQNDGGDE